MAGFSLRCDRRVEKVGERSPSSRQAALHGALRAILDLGDLQDGKVTEVMKYDSASLRRRQLLQCGN
jgi:hypothetical protein